MTRSLSLRAARRFQPGTTRASAPGSSLQCLVLVPGPDWVAVDVATGALLRGFAPPTPEPEEGWHVGQTLSAVELTLAEPDEPDDPARPEAVRLAGRPTLLPAPRRRAVRHLITNLVDSSPTQPLLGTLGPSVAYGDLDGTRPSVVVVEPDHLPRFGNGPAGPWCQFSLDGRRHALPLAGRLDSGLMGAEGLGRPGSPRGRSAARGRHRQRKVAKAVAAVGAELPRWLVVALGRPARGQVPKVVLGALPDRRGGGG